MSTQTEGNGRWREVAGEPYLASDDLDYLVRMNMELLSELWIARDRIAVLERMLVDKKVFTDGEVDSFVPDEGMKSHLENLRTIVVENVIGAPYKNDLTVNDLLSRGKALANLTGDSKEAL